MTFSLVSPPQPPPSLVRCSPLGRRHRPSWKVARQWRQPPSSSPWHSGSSQSVANKEMAVWWRCGDGRDAESIVVWHGVGHDVASSEATMQYGCDVASGGHNATWARRDIGRVELRGRPRHGIDHGVARGWCSVAQCWARPWRNTGAAQGQRGVARGWCGAVQGQSWCGTGSVQCGVGRRRRIGDD